MKIKRLSVLLGMVLALALMATPALASTVVGQDSELLSDMVTTVTWDSSFSTAIESDTVVVTWTVTPSGTATYAGWKLRGFTPKSKKDPADGTVSFDGPGAGSATFSVNFSELHLALDDGVEIGNAHFTIYLDVDVDGVTETIGCGVNATSPLRLSVKIRSFSFGDSLVFALT